MAKAILALAADGAIFEGESFGATGTSSGEVVFNTGMTGYQEVLTDPSYAGQLVTLTYPLIGNYGITDDDIESRRVQVAGFVVRELTDIYSNWRATRSLPDYLAEAGILGITGIDTRALTRRIRHEGVMMGMLSTELSGAELVAKVQSGAEKYDAIDWVRKVTTPDVYTWGPTRKTRSSASRFSTAESSSTSCGSWRRLASARPSFPLPPLPLRCSKATPTASSSRPAPAIPRFWATRSRP